jgi:uncharacterized protein with PIN domain
VTEIRRCKNCNARLFRKQTETPKEFLERNYCGPGCRRIGVRKTMSEVRTGMTYKKRDEQ